MTETDALGPSPEQRDPQLVIGVVTPVGTNTTDLVSKLKGALAEWDYESIVIVLSDLLDSVAPDHEHEDDRIKRLISAGNLWCEDNESEFGLAPLAISEIVADRTKASPNNPNQKRPGRRAYIIKSLKRPGEVELLRQVYGDAFFLIGHQFPTARRQEVLEGRLRSRTGTAPSEISERAKAIMEMDDKETSKFGQDVAKTFTLADSFLEEDGSPSRTISLLMGDNQTAPTLAEYAMFTAWGVSARSLSSSRRVGAAIVKDGSVVASGMNEVPNIRGMTPDAVQGYDYSEQQKRQLIFDVVHELSAKGWLNEQAIHVGEDANEISLEERAVDALSKTLVMDVIEFQRAVHAEAWAILDAARQGTALAGAEIYGTTYPCHLCWKTIVAAGIKRMWYIDAYPKSRAMSMYGQTSDMLKAYTGIAPWQYLRLFNDSARMQKADRLGRYKPIEKAQAQPLVDPNRWGSTVRLENFVVERFLTPQDQAITGGLKADG